MIYFLLGIFGPRRRYKDADQASEAVAASIARLEVLADHLEETADALNELVQRMREEEEGVQP